jgi:aerobic carbon-monoxide dehydrogenase large subunit
MIGQSVPRIEDVALLTGQGRFVDDLDLPLMLHAAYVRSPHAHAAVLGIETTAAKAMPGVRAVLTMADCRPSLTTTRLSVGLPSASYRQVADRPVLAIDEVAYVGEPLAIVIADSRHIAEDAVERVEVAYEPLDAVVDCRAARAADAPLVHRGAPHNLLADFEVGYGDVRAAFRNAAHVIRESMSQHRGCGQPLECRGVVAAYDAEEDRLRVWSSTQTPHAAQRLLCDLLGRDETQVRVITPDVGGGFGPKLVFYQEEVVTALAALVLRRPVKWIEDRREHFVATTQERDQFWDLEMALDYQGRILGVRGRMVHDHGAYTARGVNLPYESAQTVTLPYDIPAYELKVELALTNKVPVSPVRGAGQPQGVFAMERLLDRAAQALGMDRAEIRRRNLIAAERMPCPRPLKTRGNIPVVLDSGDYLRCQQDALARIGWEEFPVRQEAARRCGRYIGIGLANFVKGTGRGPFEPVTVRIAPSGKIQVFTGAAAMGQSTRTMLAQVVAAQLGEDLHNVVVTAGDTAGTALGFGGFNSRQAVMAGTSAHIAAVKIRDKLMTVASEMMEVAREDLEVVGAEVRVKGVPGMRRSLNELARAMSGVAGFRLPASLDPGLEATEQPVMDAMAYANGTAAVEVEVDAETGDVEVRRFVIAHDCGRMINPMIVDGQVIGGVAHGIGNALFEWMGFDETAQPVTTTLAEYLLVSAPEMPRIEVIHHETPSPLNPLGVKGVGECGVLPTVPAIVSAIEDALSPFGVRLDHAPVTPMDIIALLETRHARER